MILGNRDLLAFELQPLDPGWERRSVVDRGPWALMSVFVRGVCLTEAVEPSTDRVRQGVRVPLLSLADWFVRNARAIEVEESPASFRVDAQLHRLLERWNMTGPIATVDEADWEDARYDWYARHFWLAGADGSLVPDLGWACSDGLLWVSWRPSSSAGPRSLKFIANQLEPLAVPWREGIGALRDLVEYVAAESRRCLEGDAPAWTGHSHPLDEALTCGTDDFLSLVAPRALEITHRNPAVFAGSLPDRSVWMQATRDIDLSRDAEFALQVAVEVDKSTDVADAAQSLDEWRDVVRTGLSTSAPETAGCEAARWVRAQLDLDGEPLATDRLRAIIERFGSLEERDAPSGRNHLVLGMRRGRSAAVTLLRHERTRESWAERMELARSMGHLLLDPYTEQGVLGAASSASAVGPRRRRSGAFAAELLLPRSGLNKIIGSRDPSDPAVFGEIMTEYGVGATTAAHHMWNSGILRSRDERDALIEEHSRRRE